MSANGSSGGRSVCPSKRPEIPAFSHPFAMCRTPNDYSGGCKGPTTRWHEVVLGLLVADPH